MNFLFFSSNLKRCCIQMFNAFPDVQTNECLDNNGGCWQDKAANITACKVPFDVVLFLTFKLFFYQNN
jgi:hypothetical protein